MHTLTLHAVHRASLLKTPYMLDALFEIYKHAARPFSGESQFRDAKSAKRNSINENTHEVYIFARASSHHIEQLSNDMN